ncbi:hypothetical protein CALCODRAFT_506476 [Calocera cornea HHB12733]|uniref:Uncharacterized protein n=1 Tax=Calocera cornea HHB12733 TaxID=1353952 RepID=A0A165IW66_9BASI|nr:hypothetical protein CALCODRAFT_506476 [Calocera cornea HHB12733]
MANNRPVRVRKKSREDSPSLSEMQRRIMRKLPTLIARILDTLQAYKNLSLRCNKRDIAAAFLDIAQWSAILNPVLRFYFFMDLAQEHPLDLRERIGRIIKALYWLTKAGAMRSVATAKLEINLLPGFYFQDFPDLLGSPAAESVPHPEDIITIDDPLCVCKGLTIVQTLVSQAANALGIDEWPGVMQSRLLQDMLYARDATWAFGLNPNETVLPTDFTPPTFENYVYGRESWLWLQAPPIARKKEFTKWWEDDGRLRSQYIHLHLDGEYGADLVRSIIPDARWTPCANKDSVAISCFCSSTTWRIQNRC